MIVFATAKIGKYQCVAETEPATAGGADPAPASYRDAALGELERALALDPELRPPERFHSPAFLAVVEEARGAGGGEDAGDAGASPSDPR